MNKSFTNINESSDIWYHGTPDVRGLRQEGGFTSRTTSLDYLKDIEGWQQLQQKMKEARANGDEKAYWKYLDMVKTTMDTFTMRSPIFFTNHYGVAKTYADPSRAFDYQNSEEQVIKAEILTNNGVTINATGDRFRFIDTDKVKRGFLNAGINEKDFDLVLSRFNYYLSNKEGIKTDMIAAIAEWFTFDYIDVIGVLDSYHGGSVKSTVRMVLDPTDIKIISKMNEDKVKGGLADNKTPEDLAKKHDVPVSQIEKQLDKGDDVEMEHVDDKETAEEIAMDHVYEDPKYYDELEKMEKKRKKEMGENYSIIKKILREEIDLSVTDETPDSMTILVEYNGRNAGVIITAPANAEKTLEIVGIKFKPDYSTRFIIGEALKSLWGMFKDIDSIIVAPKPEGIEFWNKMGFNRISPNYLIKNRGH